MILVFQSNIIFGTPLLIILLLASIFIKVRISRLYSSRIGHITYNVDNYITQKKNNSDYEYTIFVCENYIANQDIFKRWNKLNNILLTKNFFIKNLIGILEKGFKNSKFIIPFNELHYDFSLTSCSKINLWINKKQDTEENKYFYQLGIKKPYICIHNRDSAYLSNSKEINESNYHDYRDFKFSDYSRSIKMLTKKNIQSVRIGELVKDEVFYNDDNFFSATGKDLSNKHVLGLVNNSEFLVSSTSGIAQISRIIRKPQLLINFTPFMINESFHAHSANSIIVPKKIINLKTNKLLSMQQISQLPYNIHKMENFFYDRKLQIIDNTQEEISDAISEMLLHIKNFWQDNEKQSMLQNKFWKSFENYKYYNELRYVLKSKISSTFLERNPSLVD